MAYHADNALPSHSEGERVLPMQKGGKQRLKKSDIWVTGSFDVPFLALSLLLLTIGLVMLFSASYAYAFYNDDGNSYAYISRQLIFAVVGLVAMFILSKLNYKVIQAATVPLLLVTLALLCLVLVYHTNLRGFRRWIPLGPITFQPSDLAKFTISVVLANYISRYYHQMRKFKYGFVYPILVIAVFCGLIYLEHHMSCTILIFLIGASLMWAGGSNWKLFAIGVGIVAGGGGAGGEPLVRDYIAEESAAGDSFGNARGVRNIFEHILVAQNNRLAKMENVTRDDLMALTADDVLHARGKLDEA